MVIVVIGDIVLCMVASTTGPRLLHGGTGSLAWDPLTSHLAKLRISGQEGSKN